MPWRKECLNAHWFLSLEDARRKIEAWRRYYNEVRPHTALDWLAPAEFARRCGLEPAAAELTEPENYKDRKSTRLNSSHT